MSKHTPYESYIVQRWQENGIEPSQWRFRLTEVGSGRVLSFTSGEEFVQFWRTLLQPEEPPTPTLPDAASPSP